MSFQTRNRSRSRHRTQAATAAAVVVAAACVVTPVALIADRQCNHGAMAATRQYPSPSRIRIHPHRHAVASCRAGAHVAVVETAVPAGHATEVAVRVVVPAAASRLRRSAQRCVLASERARAARRGSRCGRNTRCASAHARWRPCSMTMTSSMTRLTRAAEA